MKRPGVLRGIATGASVFLLATLILSIAAGASLTDAEGRPAEALTAYSYVNVFLCSVIGSIAGVWQAARADLASKGDGLIAGVAGPTGRLCCWCWSEPQGGRPQRSCCPLQP